MIRWFVRVVLALVPCLTLSMATASAAGSRTPPPLWGSLEAGRYGVGFRVLQLRDDTRSWRPERAPDGTLLSGIRSRPVRVSIWYPTSQTTARRMVYSAYVNIKGSGEYAAFNTKLARQEMQLLHRIMRGPQAVASLLRSPMHAVAEAKPAPGRFPLIAYSAGLNAYIQHANMVMGEFLASHGYIVVTVPQLGTTSLRMSLGIDPISLETQMRDLEFAIAHARRLPNADQDRLATIGHSMGGVAAVLMGMRNPQVDAAIGLDASYSAAPLRKTLTESPFYNVRNMQAPFFDIRRAANAELESSAVEGLENSDRFLLQLKGVAHSDFTSFPMIAAVIPTDIAGRTAAHARRVHELTCSQILAFLDTTFRAPSSTEAALRRQLASIQNADLVEVFTVLPGKPAPPAPEEFAFMIVRDGLEPVLERYPAAAEKAMLNRIGYRLLENLEDAPALAVFRRNVELNPYDANVWDSLAEGYLMTRRLGEARAAYQKVLEVLPLDKGLDEKSRRSLRENAEQQLKSLAAAT